VISGYAVAVTAASLFVAVWSFVLAARNREPQRALLAGLAVVEVLLVVQLVIGVVLLIGGARPGNLVTYLAYLIGALVIIPAGAAWALAERSRSSTVILGVACVAIPVMVLRLHEIWGGASA
jgi:heme A synthase